MRKNNKNQHIIYEEYEMNIPYQTIPLISDTILLELHKSSCSELNSGSKRYVHVLIPRICKIPYMYKLSICGPSKLILNLQCMWW